VRVTQSPRGEAVVTITGVSRVYSTESGDLRRRVTEPQPRPTHADGAVRVSREKGGRRGKTVTIVSGLPRDEQEVVAGELKRHCGAGGTIKGGAIEIQGDHRDKVAARLRTSGYDVKITGG
jgi:translation initiation factor 1